MSDCKKSFSDKEMMQIARGIGGLEALQEHLKIGHTVTETDIALLETSLDRIKYNIGLGSTGGITC